MSSTPPPVTPPPSRRPMPSLPVTQRVGRALETRPTITVDSGQLCQGLLPSRSACRRCGSRRAGRGRHQTAPQGSRMDTTATMGRAARPHTLHTEDQSNRNRGRRMS